MVNITKSNTRGLYLNTNKERRQKEGNKTASENYKNNLYSLTQQLRCLRQNET